MVSGYVVTRLRDYTVTRLHGCTVPKYFRLTLARFLVLGSVRVFPEKCEISAALQLAQNLKHDTQVHFLGGEHAGALSNMFLNL